jgi:hypothetical protein
MSLRSAWLPRLNVRLVVTLIGLAAVAWEGPPAHARQTVDPSAAQAASPAVAVAPSPAQLSPTPLPGCDRNGGDPNNCPGGSGAQVRCDFDADGKGDLAIGVPGEDFGRGGINVQYAKSGFLAESVFIQATHPQGDALLLGAQFGASIACGDFDGDMRGDLAVGAPFTSVGGSVWILWGRKDAGLNASHFTEIHQGAGAIPGSPKGVFGLALAAGDFNRDGIDDLAVGDPSEPVADTEHDSGTVVVVHGQHDRTITSAQQLFGARVTKDDVVVSFGWSLAAGPLVSGGGDDLVVGAPQTGWPKEYQDAGRVYLFRDHGGLVSHQAIDEGAIGAAGGLPSTFATPQRNARFGWSLTTGDFNHDGKLDLAVGIPQKNTFGASQAGAAVILPGNGVGLDLVQHHYLTQEILGATSETVDYYGWSLTSGDWNVDSFDDLAVGAPFERIEGTQGVGDAEQAGAVYVHYGAPDLVSDEGSVISQGSGLTPGTPQLRDLFGFSLASIRLGSTNIEYLVIGIPGQRMSHPNDDCNKAGAAQLAISWAEVGPITDPNYLLHQDSAAPYNIADDRQCTTAAAPWQIIGGDPPRPFMGGEFLGWAIGF